MPHTPGEETQRQSVPEPAYYHNEKRQRTHTRPRGLHASEGNKDVVAEPIHKGNMPVAPEFRTGGGQERLPEILWDPNSHKLSKTNGNIRVTSEVKVVIEVQQQQ